MVREKKINIRYFLNKSLKPVVIDGETYYRVYVRVNYDRLNTKFSFETNYGFGYLTQSLFEDFFEKKANPAINEQVREFEEEVTKIIRFEAKVIGDRYSIIGISERINRYHGNLSKELETHLQKQLHEFSTGQLPGKDLSATFHDAVFLEESYIIIEKQIPGLREKLPAHLIDRLTAYLQFRGFAGKQAKPILCLDWLDLPTQIAFKEFLFIPHEIEGLFPNEAKHSPFLHLCKQFPPSIEKVPTYLRSIDKMLAEIIC